MTAFITGTSTRTVDDLVRALGCDGRRRRRPGKKDRDPRPRCGNITVGHAFATQPAVRAPGVGTQIGPPHPAWRRHR